MRNNCVNCCEPSLRVFLDLGDQPNGNTFLVAEDIRDEQAFSLKMAVCESCWQVQLTEWPSVEFMFSDHPYITGVNVPVLTHFESLVDQVLSRPTVPSDGLVIDIGANDGSLLDIFRQRGYRTLGVDPGSRTGTLCRNRGITVCETFWNATTATSLASLNLRPNVITATAVLYHVNDIHEFVEGLKRVMDRETLFVTQCVSMKDVLEKLQFDHFYHEHTMMHSVASLKRILEAHDLEVLTVSESDVHGGSFILTAGTHDTVHERDDSVDRAIEAEVGAGLNQWETYSGFTQKVEQLRKELLELLHSIKQAGHTVFALGAPLKGSTLLNYCGIGPELVQYATEVNPFKIGRVTPGTHIPVVEESGLPTQPDYYLVLSWNYLEFFRNKYHDYLAGGGKFIVPHPKVRIITE